MKKITLAVCLFALIFKANATEKNDLVNEIWSYYAKTVNAAKYNKSKGEVWAAMYSVASSECDKILKESENRGFIDAETKTTTSEKSISMELLPIDTFFKVTYTIKYKYQLLGDTWIDGATDKYKNKIKLKVYEALIGELLLSPELQKKVDDFNAIQTKSRKKIIKGDDY